MDFIYKLFEDFILDKSKSLGQRFGLFILIISGLLLADRVTNFTYDIHVNNKINAIEKINQLKNEYKEDSLLMIQLNYLEKEYKCRKHYYDYTKDCYLWILNFSTNLFKQDNKISIKRNDTYKDIKNTNHIRSDFWMFISSNFFFLLFGLFVIITPIFGKTTNTKETILGFLLILIILICIMLFANWTANLIPTLFDNPIWNYILNFIIQSIIVFLITIVIIKSTAKKST